MASVYLQSVYILHSRPFQDSSLLVDVLSEDHGRLTVVAKGARSARGRHRFPVYPFTKLVASWQGKSDLKTLTELEQQGQLRQLMGRRMFCGLYVNELVIRLLPSHDDCSEVFRRYDQVMTSLETLEGDSNDYLEPLLRAFEFELLELMGYGLTFSDISTGDVLEPDSQYRIAEMMGFVKIDGNVEKRQGSYLGSELLAVINNDFSDVSVRRAAKRLVRELLAPHIGNKPLKSRELFR
ncbi:DNA repair protein RecO [Aurantivibrio plasticivorans]